MDKTICELFAGVGGFHLGFDRLNTGWDTVWFSQWEPGAKTQWAHDCYVSHFGEKPDKLGELHTGEDISTVIKENIPDHTLLVGGFPCLTGDALVLTQDGYKPIVKVVAGDVVVGHDGLPHRVTNFFNQGVKKTYKLKAFGMDELRLTSNHRLYVREKYFKYPKYPNGKRGHERHFTEPSWMSLEEMMACQKKGGIKNYYLGCPINTNSIVPQWDGVEVHVTQNKTEILNTLDMSSESLWYLAGRYVGDGWLRVQQKPGELRFPYSGIIICCNKDEVEDFAAKIPDEFHYTIAEERTVFKFIFSSVELAAFFAQFGRGAKNKSLPGFMFDLPANLLSAFMDGYRESDGCEIRNEKYHIIQFTTISRELAYGIAQCVQKVYGIPCKVYGAKPNRTCVIEGRAVNENTQYQIRYKLDEKHVIAFVEDGYVWYPISSVEECGMENVFDIEVEDSHSFVVNGCASHNCQDYSVAHTLASSKGIEGKKGVLWWQIRDILIAKQPAFCLFENVDRLLKSPAKQRGRDFGVILACLAEQGYSAEWRVVNAAEYGAAQRRRRTFIFAYRNDSAYGARSSAIAAQDLVGELGFMAKAFPIASATAVQEIELPHDIAEVSDKFAFPFADAGCMRGWVVSTASVEEKTEPPILLGKVLQSNVDERHYITSEKMPKWTYLKGAKKIPRKSADGHEYVFSEGPIAFPDPWDRPGRTMLTSESTLNRSTHVVSDPGTGRLRLLTPVEAERLQGFDDEWTNSGMPDRMRYFCMGNALVVPMITRMGKVLDSIIEAEA